MASLNQIPTPAPHDALAPVLHTLVERCREKLVENGSAPPRVVHIVPGELAAWDGECGQLYSRVVQITPVYPQNRKADGTRCFPIRFDAVCAIGVIRCAHTVNDRGRAPRPSEITSDGYEMTGDMMSLLHVLGCAEELSELGQWRPEGPDGGYHAGEWTFTLKL